MKKHILTLLLLISLTLTACVGNASASVGVDSVQGAAANPEVESAAPVVEAVTAPASVYKPEDLESAPVDDANSTQIQLNGDSITVDGPGATASGSTLTITAAGIYQISGMLNDGQIVVGTEDEENVTLLLAGANIHNENGSPIYVANAEKVIITLVESTENNLSDSANYINLDVDGEPNAAIFSHDDLTINGTGTLNVSANYNNGIASKDDLKITGSIINVTAVDDALKGKDSVAVLDGVITLNAGGDGIQSTNIDEADKGFIAIEGGTFNITADDDAINAATSFVIDGGSLTLNAGDDGIHAENALTINSGDVNIQQAYEGLESALITINDGDVRLVTSDDGLNATNGFGGGQADGSYFYINGGSVFLDASGDG
jgi:hypothetical protein